LYQCVSKRLVMQLVTAYINKLNFFKVWKKLCCKMKWRLFVPLRKSMMQNSNFMKSHGICTGIIFGKTYHLDMLCDLLDTLLLRRCSNMSRSTLNHFFNIWWVFNINLMLIKLPSATRPCGNLVIYLGNVFKNKNKCFSFLKTFISDIVNIQLVSAFKFNCHELSSS